MVEDARVGLGDTDDVGVDDAPHRRVRPVAHLTETTAGENLFDLPRRIAHHADRYTGSGQHLQCICGPRHRVSPQVGMSRTGENVSSGTCVALGHPDTPHVREVVV